MMTIEKNHRRLLLLMLTATVTLSLSCAPLQPTSTTGPRGGAAYPVILAEDTARRETAQASFNRLSQSVVNGRNGAAGAGSLAPVDLSPITATIASLPSANASVFLPKVGAGAVMNEEETRESLRRFLRDWRDVIGSEPARLSLVDHVVQPDGTTVVNYEQRPFRFPIRGNYGKLQIRFTADRRILSISSTCIPEADRLRSALRGLGATGAVTARLTAEEATKKLREIATNASDSSPAPSVPRLPSSAQLTPRELVTHVQPSRTKPDALEFRVAWEIEITGAQATLGYVDAITGEVFALN